MTGRISRPLCRPTANTRRQRSNIGTYQIDTKLIGREHPYTDRRNNFAEMLDDQGKYAEAEVECRQILDGAIKVVWTGRPTHA